MTEKMVLERRYKLLFLDFNGVLSYRPFWASLQSTDPLTFSSIQELLFQKNLPLLHQWMRGQVSAEDICSYLAKNLGQDYDYLLQTLIQDCKTIDLFKPARSLLAELKTGYYLVLVTDNMDCFSRWIMPAYPKEFTLFDAIFDSSLV